MVLDVVIAFLQGFLPFSSQSFLFVVAEVVPLLCGVDWWSSTGGKDDLSKSVYLLSLPVSWYDLVEDGFANPEFVDWSGRIGIIMIVIVDLRLRIVVKHTVSGTCG